MYNNHNTRNMIHIQPVCQKVKCKYKRVGPQVISNLVMALPLIKLFNDMMLTVTSMYLVITIHVCVQGSQAFCWWWSSVSCTCSPPSSWGGSSSTPSGSHTRSVHTLVTNCLYSDVCLFYDFESCLFLVPFEHYVSPLGTYYMCLHFIFYKTFVFCQTQH